MCGRIIRTSPRDAIAKHFGIHTDPPLEMDFHPHFNVCPTQTLLGVVLENRARSLRAFRWGFIPAFTFDGKGPKPIHARSETVAMKPMFQSAFQRRRCLVVADGFYEWKVEGSVKAPHVIRMRNPYAVRNRWTLGGWEHHCRLPDADRTRAHLPAERHDGADP